MTVPGQSLISMTALLFEWQTDDILLHNELKKAQNLHHVCSTPILHHQNNTDPRCSPTFTSKALLSPNVLLMITTVCAHSYSTHQPLNQIYKHNSVHIKI